MQRGPLTDGLVFDAVRVRLIEIGEAVKDVSPELLAQQPSIPRRKVAAMRDQSGAPLLRHFARHRRAVLDAHP